MIEFAGILLGIVVVGSIAVTISDSLTRESVAHHQRIRRLNRYADRQRQ